MKRNTLLLGLVAAATIAGFGAWRKPPAPEVATMLSFRVGQSFEEVVKASTYPVAQRSILPAEDPLRSGATVIKEGSVVLCFNDPLHGFLLPPTKFALVVFTHNVVDTVSTSPMLDKLPFDQAVTILENLQHQLKAGGWELEPLGVGNQWFDLTPNGKKRLYQRMFEPGHSQTAELRVPKKYGVTLRLKCTEGCWAGEKPPYLFLVDVGLSMDMFERGAKDPQVWDKTFPGNAASTAPPRFSCPASRKN